MKKIAFCLRGAIGKISGTFFTQNSLYREGKYINFQACANAIKKNIVDCNSDYSFDFFIHCWNEDLQEQLIKIYNPKKYIFENNSKYNDEINKKLNNPTDFSGASQSLSIKKSIELAEQYQQEHNFKYDRFIIFRPDLIILKNLNLDNYDQDKIYITGNKPGNPLGDFHFVMNTDFAFQFKNLYNSIENGNYCKPHFWIENYITTYMKQKLYKDNIIAGVDEEVLRKIYFTTISMYNIPLANFYQYGLTIEEIKSYNKP